MFGGPDGLRRLMSQEQMRPQSLGRTLARFGGYFSRFVPTLAVVSVLVVVSTWGQVLTPELVGQAVDCYIAKPVAGAFGGAALAQQATAGSASRCWYGADLSQLSTGAKLAHWLGWQHVFVATAQLEKMSADAAIAGLGQLVLLSIAVFASISALTGLLFFAMARAGQHVLRDIRVDLFAHLHRLSIGYYSEHEVGDLMSRITNDTEAIGQAFSFALVNVLGGILLIGWISYKMLAASFTYALLSLAVVPVMAVTTVWFSNQARRAFRISRAELGSVNAELQESISAVREVQAFNRADENLDSFRATNAANRDANVRAVAFTSALAPALEALGYLALAIVAAGGGWLLLNGEELLGASVSLGLIITFIGYSQRFNQPIQQIAVLWTNIQSAIAGGERIFQLLDEKPSIMDRPGARTMPTLKGEVTFDNVSAEYTTGTPVLRNISFNARAGQTIAIVGPTGAGKTTIINLLPRFYDASTGSVKIDGIDVRDVTAESLRRQIGIVLQDTFLFSASVMDNIRFGRPDATDAEVVAAAALAHADSFIDRLPLKYDTVLGERGSGLSQGQRQLLAIARASLANPRILILDEATSSVDTRTERLIQQAFEKLLAGRTAFVIAHRLSTIRNADVVLVLDQGRIVEQGTHDSLLAARGFYFDLYNSQYQKVDSNTQLNGKASAGAANLN